MEPASFCASHVFQKDAKQSSHTTSEGMAQDDDLVAFAVKLDQVVYHLERPSKTHSGKG